MAAKKKVAKKKAVVKKGIAVLVSRFGHDPIPVAVTKGATVEDVLEKANIDLGSREQVYIDGEDADMDTRVSDKDVISIVSPKQAGA